MSKQPRSLSSDELGELGEVTFTSICATGAPQLIVNKAIRDKTGWDFIVEFPHDNDQRVGLDSRSNPVSARFQQKSMWHDNDRIAFKLSALERLAKDPGPAFICVLKFSDKLECVSAHIIHLFDEVLALVLKSLRQHEAAGEGALNQADVYLYASRHGHEIVPSHGGLVSAISGMIGGTLEEYYASKNKQLKELGFDAEPLTFSFTLPEAEAEKVIDALLGVEVELAVSSFKGTETRFNIPLPILNISGGGTVKISAVPVDTAMISFSKERSPLRVDVKADVFRAPPELSFSPNPRRLRIASKGLEINIRKDTIDLESKPLSDVYRMSALEWRNHFSAIGMMADGPVNIQLTFGARRRSPPIKADGFVFNGDRERLEADILMLEDVSKILQLADYTKNALWGYEDFPELRRQAYFMKELFIERRAVEVDPVEIDISEGSNLPEEVTGVYISYLDLKEEVLVAACYITARISDSTLFVKFTDPAIDPPHLIVIDRNSYIDYIESYRYSQTHPMILHSKPPVALPIPKT